MNNYQTNRYLKGLCVQCGKKNDRKTRKCSDCIAKSSARRKQRRSEYRKLKLCKECGNELDTKLVRCKKCSDDQNKRSKKYQRLVKYEVMSYYCDHKTPQCQCCGCDILAMLTIDHINNDGARHREILKSSIYTWLKLNNHPNDFRVLCFNCNHAHGHYGACPHKTKIISRLRKKKEHLGQKTKFCKSCSQPSHLKYCNDCIENIYEQNWQYRLSIKNEVMTHYSDGEKPKCAKCGELEILFLTIDHINGGGNEHRRVLKSRSAIYRWLKSNSYPLGYRVLCFNCNCSAHYII